MTLIDYRAERAKWINQFATSISFRRTPEIGKVIAFGPKMVVLLRGRGYKARWVTQAFLNNFRLATDEEIGVWMAKRIGGYLR